jgi:rubrerythrin
MADKPSYLGLLNAISCAETRAHEYLSAWAEVTADADVRTVLLTVAAREGEHGMAFAKRINELGFELQPTDDPGFADRLETVKSRDKTDLEKLEAIGLLDFCVADGEPDVFDNFFRDHSIDIQTGELLGRYIAEERDTLRLVSGCASILESRGNGEKAATATSDQLANLEDKVDAVCRAVEELQQIVSAQAVPGNGAKEARPSTSTRSRRR